MEQCKFNEFHERVEAEVTGIKASLSTRRAEIRQLKKHISDVSYFLLVWLFCFSFRALVKRGGKGISKQVISKFFISYRVTPPNPVVPEGKSPAKFMFRRKFRTVYTSILQPRKTNKSTCSFQVRTRVLVKSYQGDRK